MIEQKKTQIPLWKNPVIIAASLATLGVVVFGWWAGSQQVCNVDFWGNRSCTGTKWSAFLEASPNEVGDTLAGFAGALAFVWLIATVVLQGQELREQRQEFVKMADAQKEQADVMKKQRDFFEDEQRLREETRAKALFEERIASLNRRVYGSSHPAWEYRCTRNEVIHSGSLSLYCSGFEGSGIARLRHFVSHAVETINEVHDFYVDGEIVRFPTDFSKVEDWIDLAKTILELKGRLSEAELLVLESLRLNEFVENLNFAKELSSNSGGSQ